MVSKGRPNIDFRHVPLLILLGIVICGCDSRPRAPALRDDPVYQNDKEGIRFLAPESWKQTIRGEAPPGKVLNERPLVEYRRTSGDFPATLRLSLIDLPTTTDLAGYLAAPSFSVEKWTVATKAEETSVGSLTGMRFAFTGRAGKTEFAREVVAVRRSERVYLFTVLFSPKDPEVKDQLRKVVESVIWKSGS